MKTLYDLELNEAKEVIRNNQHLMERIRRFADDNAYDWCDEVLRTAPRGIDYSIGGYGYSYVDFNNVGYSDALDYLIQINNDFCVFSDENKKKLEKALKYFDIMEEDGYKRFIKEKDFRNLEDVVYNAIKALQDDLRDFLVSFYETDDDYVIEEALECEWLDGYYFNEEDGNVYKEAHDYIVY